MNEELIRAELAAKAAPEPTTSDSQPTVSLPQDKGYTPEIGNSLTENRLFDYYQIDQSDRITDAKPKLDYLIQWAKEITGSDDELVITQYLKQYDSVFNLPPARKFARLYEYAKLNSQMRRFEQEVKVYG